MYQGIYHGSQKHQPDLDRVLERSWNNDLSKIIITAGNIEESKKALELARTDGEICCVKVSKILGMSRFKRRSIDTVASLYHGQP